MQQIDEFRKTLTPEQIEALRDDAEVLNTASPTKRAAKANARRPQSERKKIPKGTFLRRVRA